MRLNSPLRSSFTGLAMLLLVCGLAERCSALILLKDATTEDAKELGVTVRSLPSANNDARVQINFKATGPMKNFKWADLTVMRGGKRLVTVPILPRKPTQESPEESKQLEFYMDPAALPDTVVTIVVYNEPFTGTGYRFKLKDFVPEAASRAPKRGRQDARLAKRD